MKIGQRLALGAAVLTVVPLVITAGLLSQRALEVADDAITSQTMTQLVSLRDLKTQQVQDEVDSRLAALKALAANRTTIEAMKGFRQHFPVVARELGVTPAQAQVQRQAMLDFVQAEFAPEFVRRNPTAAPDLTTLVDGRDPNMAALQHQFIVANGNKLGEKDKLAQPAIRSSYGDLHAQVHASLERAQKLFGFYDIFLIDTATDQVVYTVFKELDFGSRLSDGIAARSKLAEAYLRVKNAKSPEDIHLSDFEPYLPSYNDQAAFAAVPLFDGDRQIGVLAMQYPIDKITAAMNSNKTWSRIGLGRTGDVFVVGADQQMRSDARGVAEESQRQAFIDGLSSRLDPARLALLKKKLTTIGLLKVDSEDTRNALAGKAGSQRLTDMQGVETLSAYGPVKVGGQQWGIVARIDAAEVDAPVQALAQQTLWRTLMVASGVLLVVGPLLAWFLRNFMRPIRRLHDTVRLVAEGDSKARSQLLQADEVGDLGRAFDSLLDERIAQLESAQKENETLNQSVINLLQTVFQMSNKDLTVRAAVTEDVIGTLSSSINQLSDETSRTLQEVRRIADEVQRASESVNHQAGQVDETAQGERQALEQMSAQLTRATRQLTQVAKLSEQSHRSAGQASAATDAALKAVGATVRGMDQLRESISETEKRFKRLGERSQEISSVVSLINTISERTHVLALNASMQAATAGEAGRGFAVVAEEVQRLSESSRQATQQIAQLVHNIQLETNETVYTMNRLISQVVSQSEQAQQAGDQMTQTQHTTAELVAVVQQIASSSEQQSLLARELQLSVAKLNKGSLATVSAISEQTRSTETLAHSSRKLLEAVSQFTLPQSA